MNNCLLFVLLKNFNISSLRFIILSVFFKNNINVSHVILKFMKNIIY